MEQLPQGASIKSLMEQPGFFTHTGYRVVK